MITAFLVILVVSLLIAGMLGVVGPQQLSTGTAPTSNRVDKTGALNTAQTHGKYYQGNECQRVYGGCYSAGVAPGGTITTTAPTVLYNPANSGVNLSILRVSFGYVSGTIGTGTMFHCANMTATQTAPSSGNLVTVVNLSGGGAGQGVLRSGATVVAPTVIRPALTLDPMLATSVLGLPIREVDIDGEILIPPGCSYQIQSIAASGTSPLIAMGVVWEEIPIASS